MPLVSIVVFSFWKRSGFWIEPALSLDAYAHLLDSRRGDLLFSLFQGGVAGVLAFVLAFPIAYLVSFKANDKMETLLLSLFAVPFFVSVFVRSVMWVPVLGRNGPINAVLLGTGLVSSPVEILGNDSAVMIGALSATMPFVIFTGWLSMEMMDDTLIEAAKDLGARPLTVVRDVIVPLAAPGLLIGVLFVLTQTMGESIFASTLGGVDAVTIGTMTEQAFSLFNVPLVSAIMVVSMLIYVIGLVVITRMIDLAEIFTTFE